MTSRTNLGFEGDNDSLQGDTNRLQSSKGKSAIVKRTVDYEHDKFRSKRAYVSVAILCIINLINFMDRYTIAGILDDVQQFYSLDNQAAGLLQTSFIVSYMIMAPIFGYLGDRYSRKYLMMFGVFFWSITTLLGSFVPREYFGVFVFLRLLVGTGEASYSTIAPTIIADLFTKDQRSRVLALFYFAIPVGSGLGYIAGSQITIATGNWQWSLRLTPIIGFASVILTFLFLREPPRGESEGGTHLHSTSVFSDVREITKTKSYIWSTAGFTCVTFAAGALAWWAPKYMQLASDIQRQNQDITQGFTSSLIFGGVTCVAGIIGVILGSTASQYYRRINPRADPLICAYSVLVCVPLAFAGLIIADRHLILSWVFVFVGEICLCMNWTLVADMLLYVVIPTRRSLAQSFQILISHAFGDAISPYICGLLADGIIKNPNSDLENFIGHQYSLYLPIGGLVLGGFFFFMSAFYVERDKKKCSAVIQGDASRQLWCEESLLPQPVRLPADVVIWPSTPHAFPV